MSRWLILHLEAPLMSFGRGVDQHGVTDDHPGLSMITGLVANALGWTHADVRLLDALQARLILASREESVGQRLIDYQTVDLGQRFLTGTGWTTRGRPEGRDGAFSDGTHIRYRHFLADAAFTVILGLKPGDGPTLDEVCEALRRPARPLFLGRKSCIPSRPLVQVGETAWIEAPDVREAVLNAPALQRPLAVAHTVRRRFWVPTDTDSGGASTLIRRDLRSWRANMHEGSRLEEEGVYGD